MVGALNMMRRRRFAGGGFTSEVLSDPYDDRAVPPPGQNDGALDYEASQRVPGTTPDTLATTPAQPQQGALQDAAENAGAANRINRASQNFAQQLQQQQNVSAILTAGGQPPSPMFEMAPTTPQQGGGFLDGLFGGKSNLPLLAAAGAMLAPTKSGAFSEALGNAFTAAVPVAEKERALQQQADIWSNRLDLQTQSLGLKKAIAERTAELKAQGLNDNAIYHQLQIDNKNGLLQVRALHYERQDNNAGQKTATQADVAAARIHALNAQAALNEAKTAHPNASNASVEDTAAKALMEKPYPNADPPRNYTYDEALAQVRNIPFKNKMAEQRGTTAAGNLQARVDAMKGTDEYRRQSLVMRQYVADEASADRLMTRAVGLATGLGVPLDRAVQQVLTQNKLIRNGQPASVRPTVPSPAGAAPATPSPGKKPEGIDVEGTIAAARSFAARGGNKDMIKAKLIAAGITPPDDL